MERILKMIENYLVKNFGKNQKFVLDNSLQKTDDNIYGIKALEILVQKNETDGTIHYKPLFKS